MRSISRLHKRKDSGIFYCRAAVPKSLVSIIGKREIKVSLGTTNLRLARELVLIESAKINEEFSKLRGIAVASQYQPRAFLNTVVLQQCSGVTLSDLIERYFASPEKQRLAKKTKLDYLGNYKVITELLGAKTDIKHIKREDCRRVQQVIMHLPANAAKRFPNMTFLEIAEHCKKANVEPMTANNMNKFISNLSVIMEWAAKEQLIDSNPARGLSINENLSMKDKRNPFTPEQLKAIFGSHVMQSYQDNNHARFWVPMMALWTGARLNEICQLRTTDIQKRDNILCMVISEGNGKTLKTVSANRIVPIHPQLIKLGFQNLHNKAKADGHFNLFPELSVSCRGKPSDLVSKWFTRYTRTISIKTNKTCFHSFRHNFRDALREAGIERDIVKALGGWKDKAAGTEEVYGKGYSVTRLYQAICQIDYPIDGGLES